MLQKESCYFSVVCLNLQTFLWELIFKKGSAQVVLKVPSHPHVISHPPLHHLHISWGFGNLSARSIPAPEDSALLCNVLTAKIRTPDSMEWGPSLQ